ncbi:MAG: hypothetical protein AB3N16_00155, partial [Flavobacteriaceae bacterium]
NQIGIKEILVSQSVLMYLVALFFIYLFYKRYKDISVLDNTKSLMSKIIRTRKTVKSYIVFSLGMVVLTIAIVLAGIYLDNNFANHMMGLSQNNTNLAPEDIKRAVMVTVAGIGLFLTLLFGGFYYLIYGLLLRKLKKNYRELKKLEV